MGFSTIEITSKKVRGHNVDFFDKSKKFVEATGIFWSAKLHKKGHGNDLETGQNLVLDVST